MSPEQTQTLRWPSHGMMSAVTDATCVLLLERCQPGGTLADALPESEQDQIVAGLLRRLWQAPVDGYRFRPLQAMFEA